MNKNQPIVIIDSGVGGINVLKVIKDKLPKENIIYIADQKNMPFGDLNRAELLKCYKSLIEKAKTYDPKLIVCACNTLDSMFENNLRAEVIPTISIISPTATAAAKVSKKGNIAVMATKTTIDSQMYAKKMISGQGNINIIAIECSGLAEQIEKNEIDKKNIDSIAEVLKNNKVDTLILGCTHYTILKSMFSKIIPNIEIVDSSEIAGMETIEYLNKNGLTSNKHEKDIYITSGDVSVFVNQLNNMKIQADMIENW